MKSKFHICVAAACFCLLFSFQLFAYENVADAKAAQEECKQEGLSSESQLTGEHLRQLSRTCVDYVETNFMRHTTFPTECLIKMFKSKNSDMVNFGDCVKSSRMATTWPSAGFFFIQAVMDALSMTDRGELWKLGNHVQIHLYTEDPDVSVRQAANGFVNIILWTQAKPQKISDSTINDEIETSVDLALRATSDLISRHRWSALTAEEVRQLQERLSVQFPPDHVIARAALAKGVSSLKNWISEN
jgi:hypothetical protein